VQLELEVSNLGQYAVVAARGELDLTTVAEFRETLGGLIVDGQVNLVVDLQDVTFIDSMGLGALVGARRKAHALRGSFAIACRNPTVLRVFRLTGLDRVFTLHDDIASAMPTGH
jgi:anti-sigma B factor antagonist